ncbi:MAG TPA: hypothetical protein VIK61_09115 [Acidimicrobiia bacterium]
MTDADEAWGFEWGSADGNGGFVRLALHREARVAWFWAYVWRPGMGPVAVRDHEVAPPRGAALEIRADALWSELVCETPGEHWSIGLEAFAVALDDADDALRGEIGERVALGFDFEWETAGAPFTSSLDGVVREEQPGVVRGEVLLGRERMPLDTVGRFEHVIGDTGRTDLVNRSTIAWDDGSWWSSLTGPEFNDLEITAESRAVIPIGDSVVTRGLGRATAGGRAGTGWMESVAPVRAKIPGWISTPVRRPSSSAAPGPSSA